MNLFKNLSLDIYYNNTNDPLNRFYIPVLSAAIRYDRSAGFFNSSALAVAAEGVAKLIQNGGRMRLLVGALLDESDVQAISDGYDLHMKVREKLLEHFTDPTDALMKKRLEVLAWMVADGTLEIKVVLPRDIHGNPIPSMESQDYYHPKSAIFTDIEGNQVGFTGSINESATAWLRNFEEFMVYFSWEDNAKYLKPVINKFNALWNGTEEDWIAIDIPDAVQQRLLQYKPTEAPVDDPFTKHATKDKEKGTEETTTDSTTQKEKILFQFLRDAPYLVDADGLGAHTSPVVPFPHQTRVADKYISDYPSKALFCDEVGLGKTIEAGLVLRQLILSGIVKRCLILVPKSVLKQWQEELYEKFNLSIPRYDGKYYFDANDKPITSQLSGNPWECFPVMLAGSQLAKRTDRRDQILNTKGWDLLVVDEAHHARRKDFKDERTYRPNSLLSLLNEIDEQRKATSLLLMTATPMQVHPVEVWDLLKLLGLGGRWGADEKNFLNYFTELRKTFNNVDWNFVFDLINDFLLTGGLLDPNFVMQAKEGLGVVKYDSLKNLPTLPDRTAKIRQLGKDAQAYIKEMASLNTPLKQFIYRNTRTLLKEYRRRGILTQNVPNRKPELVRIQMNEDEFKLYERIEEYINHFYQKYESERRGLGFIMTVYRRRLTSSFYAVRCSLERRFKYLRGEITPEETFQNDDIEQDDLDMDVTEDILSDETRERFKAELDYIQDFLKELRMLSVADTKIDRLKEELRSVFKKRDKVIVFSQYTDTMDYVRDQLVEVYGHGVACYSGRGGEIWNGIAWVLTTKEYVKKEFKEGEVHILICTDSASEGLNLQTCGVLINYDMPWNPMRVEQRIGRIDRIGQVHDTVWISNYFYIDTIEDLIYSRLVDRIDWFKTVVGELQPILAEVGEITRRLAMVSVSERERELKLELDELQRKLLNKEYTSLNLDNFGLAGEDPQEKSSPISLRDIEKILVSSTKYSKLWSKHPKIIDAYQINWNGKTSDVTFSSKCFDEYPDSVQFMSYGNELFQELLQGINAPENSQGGRLYRIRSENNEYKKVAWYRIRKDDVKPFLIQDINQLEECLEKEEIDGIFTEEMEKDIKTDFVSLIKTKQEKQTILIRQRKLGQILSAIAKAKTLLKRATLIEICLGMQPKLFEKENYPMSFDNNAIKGLSRHHYPWGALLRLAYQDDISVNENDIFYQEIKSSSKESLKSRFTVLEKDADNLVRTISRRLEEENVQPAGEGEIHTVIYR